MTKNNKHYVKKTFRNAIFYCGDSNIILDDLPDKSVHCIITSPPYWTLRNYEMDNQIGLEEELNDYIDNLVKIFEKTKRILTDDGVFWLNIGDGYAGGGKAGKNSEYMKKHTMFGKSGWDKNRFGVPGKIPCYLKRKDMLLIPSRLIISLQLDGWYVRQKIPWVKRNSMPESHKDRPNASVEYVYLLSKNEKYFFDMEAAKDHFYLTRNWRSGDFLILDIPTQSRTFKHYAAFPDALIEPLVISGTSMFGCCPKCKLQWKRIIKSYKIDERSDKGRTHSLVEHRMGKTPCPSKGWKTKKITLGFAPSCDCYGKIKLNLDNIKEAEDQLKQISTLEREPCVILDPFAGSFTTVMIATDYNRIGMGIELNPEYVDIGIKRFIERDNESLF